MSALPCSSHQIDLFLTNGLSETEQTAFERHLDECDACCAELQRRTADASMWENARNFLSNTSGREDFNAGRADVLSLFTDERGHGFADQLRTSQSESLPRLDFLGPTDDPQMLGRFAGYEISGVVGWGGMGIVLKGLDPALNRYAAIKVLAPHFASSSASRQRFAREAQAAAAVVHDNVIAIHGVSEFNGLPYLVMPYMKGISLQKRIDREGPLTIEEILRIALQTARGLAAAHHQGLVHRDIKPGNILLPENVERVLITDFGLARAADDASLTRSGVIAGTPQYMSPEQARGEAVDHRSDLFSLGCVIYAMSVGHVPFRAETPYGILRRITDTPHRPLQQIRSDVPGWMCVIVDRLLQKNAADRFASASDVACLLEDCLAHVQQPTQKPLPAGVKPPSRMVLHFDRKWVRMLTALIVIGTAAAWYAVQVTRKQLDAGGLRNASIVNAPRVENPPETSVAQKTVDAQAEPAIETDLSWRTDHDLERFESDLKELAVTFGTDDLENSAAKGIEE